MPRQIYRLLLNVFSMCILNAINHCKNKVVPIRKSIYQEKHKEQRQRSLALQNKARDNKIKTSDFCRNGKYKGNNTCCFHVRDHPSSHKITGSICKLKMKTTNNVSRSSITNNCKSQNQKSSGSLQKRTEEGLHLVDTQHQQQKCVPGYSSA